MSLLNTLTTCVKNEKPIVDNSLGHIEVDFYYMAAPYASTKSFINMWVWSVIVDNEGYVYAMLTTHFGDMKDWKQVIRNKILDHLYNVNIHNLIANRLVRDLDINKENHLIPLDDRCNPERIGINGSDTIYIRRDKFTNAIK